MTEIAAFTLVSQEKMPRGVPRIQYSSKALNIMDEGVATTRALIGKWVSEMKWAENLHWKEEK